MALRQTLNESRPPVDRLDSNSRSCKVLRLADNSGIFTDLSEFFTASSEHGCHEAVHRGRYSMRWKQQINSIAQNWHPLSVTRTCGIPQNDFDGRTCQEQLRLPEIEACQHQSLTPVQEWTTEVCVDRLLRKVALWSRIQTVCLRMEFVQVLCRYADLRIQVLPPAYFKSQRLHLRRSKIALVQFTQNCVAKGRWDRQSVTKVQ